jgi:hypothetical protein
MANKPMKNPFVSLDELVQKDSKKSLALMADNQVNYLKQTRKDIDSLIRGIEYMRKQYAPRSRWKRYAAVALTTCMVTFNAARYFQPEIKPIEERVYSAVGECYEMVQSWFLPESVAGVTKPGLYRTRAGAYYISNKGDSLSKIAQKVTGNPKDWRRIKEYNKLPSNSIEPYQRLRIPAYMVRQAQ